MSAITNLSNVVYEVIQANNGIITILNVGTISLLDGATFLTITGDEQVQGNIIGTFTGNMTGNVVGNVPSNLTGSVTSNVNGNLFRSVTGNVEEDITSTGISTFKVLTAQSSNGPLIGDVTGNLTGNITGDVTGSAINFTGQLEGQITDMQTATVIAPNIITDANISTTTAIEDTKLGTI
jgi:hypothetical protein